MCTATARAQAAVCDDAQRADKKLTPTMDVVTSWCYGAEANHDQALALTSGGVCFLDDSMCVRSCYGDDVLRDGSTRVQVRQRPTAVCHLRKRMRRRPPTTQPTFHTRNKTPQRVLHSGLPAATSAV